MPRKISRSAESGRFVSRAEAKRSPGTTVEETADGYISPAMESAGVAVLHAMDGDEYEVVRAVYQAMRRARA